jgi:hypothetical protein
LDFADVGARIRVGKLTTRGSDDERVQRAALVG